MTWPARMPDAGNNGQLDAPIAMLVFNRPEQTRRVFERVRIAQPRRLLVVADGPRRGRTGEMELCAETREIFRLVDWDCEVLTNFAQENMGCRKRVATGL